jgi:hypothetical protein
MTDLKCEQVTLMLPVLVDSEIRWWLVAAGRSVSWLWCNYEISNAVKPWLHELPFAPRLITRDLWRHFQVGNT